MYHWNRDGPQMQETKLLQRLMYLYPAACFFLVSFFFLAIFCLIESDSFPSTLFDLLLWHICTPGQISLFVFFRWLERDFLRKTSFYRNNKHKQFLSLHVRNMIFRNASNSNMQGCFRITRQLERIVITAPNNLGCDSAVLWTDTANDQLRTQIN